jgi:hypothetical protein
MRDEKKREEKIKARHPEKREREEKREDKKGGKKDDKEEDRGGIKHSGSFEGKSNALGHGGRAAQMKAKGVPGGVIGAIARKEGAAPGGPNYHK